VSQNMRTAGVCLLCDMG